MGKKPLGKPKQRMIDKVKNNMEKIEIRDEETVAQDRNRMEAGLYCGNGPQWRLNKIK